MESDSRVAVLDHGYISLIEHWGSDQAIIETARQSTDKGFLGWGPNVCPKCNGEGRLKLDWTDKMLGDCLTCGNTGQIPGDEKLLRFLHEKKHSTPFEFAGLTIEVKAPLMVFREWHRHRVPFGYSEVSARYVPLPNENYCPTVRRVVEGAQKAGRNRQAQAAGEHVAHEHDAVKGLAVLQHAYDVAQQAYEELLRLGWPKELARLPVPVGRYSRMRATGNLRGWLGFMTLRMAPGAQEEIRVYANQVAEMVKLCYPRTWELFMEGMKP